MLPTERHLTERERERIKKWCKCARVAEPNKKKLEITGVKQGLGVYLINTPTNAHIFS